MRIDVNAFLGPYPFREVPGTSATAVLAAMDRAGIDEAWVTYLPAVFWPDPMRGNALLRDAVAGTARLRPVPAVHPGLAGWQETLAREVEAGCPAVRCDPGYCGLDPAGDAMIALACATGRLGVPLMMAVRLEDARQRDPRDGAPELPAWAVRKLLRSDPAVRLLITHADRDHIQEVYFGSTPAEAARIHWDISWVWGPPEDHLALLLDTIGPERFVFGTGMPLRLPETGVARLDLLDLAPDARGLIEAGTAGALTPLPPRPPSRTPGR
jgi:hypothetical protein